MAISSVRRESRLPERLTVKVQSVETHHLSPSAMGSETLGQWIDRTIIDSQGNGRFPNKLTIDLNPPSEPAENEI